MIAILEQRRGDDEMTSSERTRCSWVQTDSMRNYHDIEWGVPVHDESQLFEVLTLEGAQAGLSWNTILARRTGYRRAFANFQVDRVAQFSPEDVDRLVVDASIIRHRAKIESTVTNAVAIQILKSHGDTLESLLWSFVGGAVIHHDWSRQSQISSSTIQSKAMSSDLKKRGFRFVGPTTCYSLMQTAGLVNDHHDTCFRYREVKKLLKG